MEGFGPRSYRDSMGGERFSSFSVSVEESDLWVGIDIESCSRVPTERLVRSVRTEIIQCRRQITDYAEAHRGFLEALRPVPRDPEAGELISSMIDAGIRAGIGPMGAVAGTLAYYVGRRILSEFPVREVVVENGGDIFLQTEEDLNLQIFAGESPLSNKLGITVPYTSTPLGVCTSAGTVGPSLSLGRADAVMIACRDVSLADAYATAYGNMVKRREDVDRVIAVVQDNDDILSAVIIKDDKAGICGRFEVHVHR